MGTFELTNGLDLGKRKLKGSIFHDNWKFAHKEIPNSKNWYGGDVDFLLLDSNYDNNSIIAVLSLKSYKEYCVKGEHGKTLEMLIGKTEEKLFQKFLFIPKFLVVQTEDNTLSKENVEIDVNDLKTCAVFQYSEKKLTFINSDYIEWEQNFRKGTTKLEFSSIEIINSLNYHARELEKLSSIVNRSKDLDKTKCNLSLIRNLNAFVEIYSAYNDNLEINKLFSEITIKLLSI